MSATLVADPSPGSDPSWKPGPSSEPYGQSGPEPAQLLCHGLGYQLKLLAAPLKRFGFPGPELTPGLSIHARSTQPAAASPFTGEWEK
jgi:hypothetical protein